MCARGRIVIAYQGSLYDMTHFTGHPGGVGRLQMAAGNDLEVYWGVYTQHNRGHIMEHMKRYKIGEVSPQDMKLITENTVFDNSVYSSNPEPYPGLLTNTRYNAMIVLFMYVIYCLLYVGTPIMQREDLHH